jgi:hypothetical protein
MKRLPFATALFAAAPMFAGVKIVSESTDLATKKVTTDTILLDANRMRLESDDGRAMMFLTDGGRNRIVILDKARNTYQEIDQQTMDQMGQMMAGASSGAAAQMEAAMKNMTPEQRKMVEQAMKGKMPQAAAPAAASKTVYTAKGSGSVNGFSCTKYEGDNGGQKEAEVCAALPAQLKLSASDMQIFEKMREFSAGLLSSLAKSPVKVNVPTGSLESGYEGFPIQRTDFDNGQATKRSELKSLTRASLSDVDFSLGDAKKVELPIPGGAKGKR